MAYDAELADRVRDALGPRDGLTERKMFGGLSFMLRGNMCCGVVKDDLVVRVGQERFESALARPHARPMDFTGRPLSGMVYVGPEGHRSDDDLADWVKLGVDFAASLPPK
jgi:TfoX/Sxy family transcriptional regulator of competence genes